MRKKEVSGGKAIPEEKVLHCVEHQVQIAWHGAPSHLLEADPCLSYFSALFSILKPIFYWSHSATDMSFSLLISYYLKLLEFLENKTFFIFRSPMLKTVCLNKLLPNN